MCNKFTSLWLLNWTRVCVLGGKIGIDSTQIICINSTHNDPKTNNWIFIKNVLYLMFFFRRVWRWGKRRKVSCLHRVSVFRTTLQNLQSTFKILRCRYWRIAVYVNKLNWNCEWNFENDTISSILRSNGTYLWLVGYIEK